MDCQLVMLKGMHLIGPSSHTARGGVEEPLFYACMHVCMQCYMAEVLQCFSFLAIIPFHSILFQGIAGTDCTVCSPWPLRCIVQIRCTVCTRVVCYVVCMVHLVGVGRECGELSHDKKSN